MQDWERAAWKPSCPCSDDEILALTGSPSHVFGEKGYTSTERTAAPARPPRSTASRPAYQGEGSKTIIPAKAMAKLTFRLVPDQSPAKILAQVEAHFKKHCPPGVGLTVHTGHSGEPYLTDPHSGAGKAAQRALETTFAGAEVALIREGGSIPIVQTFKDVLGVETLLLGLALPDCRAHSPNENFPLENFHAGATMSRNLLKELAKGV